MSSIPSSANAVEGMPSRMEMHGGHVRLCVLWLAAGVATTFLLSLLLDVGIIFWGPLALLALGTTALMLLVRGASAAWVSRQDRGTAALVGLAAPLAVVAFVLLLSPAMKAGGYVQAQLELIVHRDSFDRIVADPRNPDSFAQRKLWLSVGGAGQDRLFAFGYGGFLSMDQDIVYDPRDKPETRSMTLLHADAASCRHLNGHYYTCFLDY